ncbi:MAG: DUF4810 domain-containing protein [Opitutaceae bacterium]|nr:DUF4810 domain-containing protein [Opitutaceae bacterium]
MSCPFRLLVGAILLLLLCSGCQTARPLYYWGNYEATLYTSYANPGKMPPEEQILKLQEDITKAAAAGLPVHPGLHSQLGYLYLQGGNADAARKEFETEKALYPESAVLMDRFLKTLTARGAS